MGNNPSVQVRGLRCGPVRCLLIPLLSSYSSSSSVQVPDGSAQSQTEYVDLNYWKEEDSVAWGHMKDGKPDVFTHALALHINLPQGAQYRPPIANGGVGLVLSRSGDGFTVLKMLKGGPAHKSYKIQKGDTLINIDGKELNSADGQASGGLIASLAGVAGSSVTLGFKSADGESKKVVLTRDENSFPDELAFNVEHYGQKYGQQAAPRLIPRSAGTSMYGDASVPPYVPPPIIRAPSPPLYPMATRHSGDHTPGFGKDRVVVSISPRQGQSPHETARDDPALQPGFKGYKSDRVVVRQPIRVSGSSSRDELRVRLGESAVDERRSITSSPTVPISPRDTGERRRRHASPDRLSCII